MTRAIVLVLDSFGIGAAPDAARFGDTGANTLGSIAHWCAQQGRPLHIPNLLKAGLGHAAQAANNGVWLNDLSQTMPQNAWYGAAAERSMGKDTPSGHWEMMACPVDFDWGYLPEVFPADLMNEWYQACGITGSLGNCHASGTDILDALGDEHVRTGLPICYTSSDSVFQIAAHEEHFGLERLLHMCELAKPIFDRINIARVIARPFLGQNGQYKRTGHRRDYTTEPPHETLLDRLISKGREVHAVGKIKDIFAHRGVSHYYGADGNSDLCAKTLDALNACPDGGMVFTNLVDFDMLYGHRRDILGYAQALEAFDAWLPQLLAQLKPDDLLAMTADHGCDPAWRGTDHTREFVPLLFCGSACAQPRDLGRRTSFADLGQTLAQWLGVGAMTFGVSCLEGEQALMK